MSNVEIINESPLTMAELKEKLENVKKRDKELKTRALKTQGYLNNFIDLKAKDSLKIKEEITKLQIPRLKDRHIKKIVDIMPKDMDSLKIIFTGESITVKQEDLQKILEVIKAG